MSWLLALCLFHGPLTRSCFACGSQAIYRGHPHVHYSLQQPHSHLAHRHHRSRAVLAGVAHQLGPRDVRLHPFPTLVYLIKPRLTHGACPLLSYRYYAKTDTPALCRTSSLVEELGQIEYIFSDKTGTLTCNEMEFQQCTIAGVEYAEVVEDAKRGERGPDGSYIGGQQTFEELRRRLKEDEGREADIVREFVALLAICHTVIPEVKDDGQVIYQASSPDEAALVSGAELLGYRFHTRKPRSIFVDVLGRDQEYQILNVCEFNSTRKRMSTIIRTPSGKIKLYCKGADTVIFDRLAKGSPYAEATTAHLEVRRHIAHSTPSAVLTFLHSCFCRTTLPRDFERSASPRERSPPRSTASGRTCTTRLPVRSLGGATLSTTWPS